MEEDLEVKKKHTLSGKNDYIKGIMDSNDTHDSKDDPLETSNKSFSYKIDSEKLVVGDVVEIPVREKMPCDILLLSGSCIMNESMLTGESIPVIKSCITASDSLFSSEDKNNILYNGTECLQTKGFGKQKVIGIVLNPGFYTTKGQ